MKNQTYTNVIIRSSLALALALALWSSGQARSAEPTAGMMMGGKMMSETNMTPRHQAMQERRGKMMADMQAQDAQLTGQITEMNSAPEGKKLDLMAAIVTRMATQRTAMNMRMQNMQGGMMGNMMSPMPMDTNAMSREPMMQGKMPAHHQAMQEQRGKMMADMQAQDAQLTGQITAMNRAPEGKKLDLMAAILTRMVAQRTAMNMRMQNMQGGMMGNMMPPMQTDTNSMLQDSTMQGMKGMGEKSGDAQEEQK